MEGAPQASNGTARATALSPAESRRAGRVRPIVALTTSILGGIVEGRVKDKTPIRSITRYGVTMEFFNFNFFDNTGSVRVLVAGDISRGIHDRIHDGRAYRFTAFETIPAHPKADKKGPRVRLKLLKVFSRP